MEPVLPGRYFTRRRASRVTDTARAVPPPLELLARGEIDRVTDALRGDRQGDFA